MVPSSANAPPPAEVMFRMITGFWVSQIVGVAARLNIAEHLQGGAMSAQPTGCVSADCQRGANARVSTAAVKPGE